MKIKAIPALVKATGVEDGLDLGQFTAYASIFDTVDSMGDVVEKGAFTNSLKAWAESDAPIPVYWSHLMGADPEMNLGHVITAAEDEKGLLVTAQLDIENNSKAAYVYQLLKGKRVREMSFAYDVIDGTEREGSTGLDLKELKLHEVSVVPIGANPDTEILSVKARELKAGRVISAKNEATIRSALDAAKAAVKALTEVLAISGDTASQDEASGKAAAKNEDRGSDKFEEPSPNPTVNPCVASIQLARLRG